MRQCSHYMYASPKRALGTSPAFSPAAVKETLSSLFLPPELNILLGKGPAGDATGFLRLHQVGPDVT